MHQAGSDQEHGLAADALHVPHVDCCRLIYPVGGMSPHFGTADDRFDTSHHFEAALEARRNF
jgi:hypothetical protein